MSKLKIVLLVILGLVAIVAAGAGMGAYDRTLVSWTVPLAIGVVGAGVSSPLAMTMWPKLTGETSRWINAAAHAAFFGILFPAGFLILNSVFTDKSTSVKEQVEVVAKYQKQHQSSNGGRRHHRAGRKWTTYHVTIRFGNGVERTEGVTLSRYNRIRSGSQMNVTLETGLFGPQVITRF